MKDDLNKQIQRDMLEKLIESSIDKLMQETGATSQEIRRMKNFKIKKMIDKQEELKSVACLLLDCGSMDLDFLVDLADTINNKRFIIKGEESFLFTFEMEGKVLETAIDNIKDNQGESVKIDINTLIYEVFEMVVKRVQELYNIELEQGTDYEIYTNCLDSHLSLIDDFTETHNEETEISKEEQEEVKAIIEQFN